MKEKPNIKMKYGNESKLPYFFNVARKVVDNDGVSIEVDAHGADVSAKSDSKSVSVKPRVGSTMIN